MDAAGGFVEDITTLRGQLLGLTQQFSDQRPHGEMSIDTIDALQRAGNALGRAQGLLQQADASR
jgi:hypothetical protein